MGRGRDVVERHDIVEAELALQLAQADGPARLGHGPGLDVHGARDRQAEQLGRGDLQAVDVDAERFIGVGPIGDAAFVVVGEQRPAAVATRQQGEPARLGANVGQQGQPAQSFLPLGFRSRIGPRG